MTRKTAAVLLVLSLAVLALAALPAAGLAAKGGNGGNTSQGGGGKGGGGGKPGGGGSSGSLTLVVLDPDDGGANYGEQVTFQVSTTATAQPLVRVDCYQNGAHVYWSSSGFYDGYPWPWTQNFTLSSSYWTGGSASCAAVLYMYDGRRYRDLTSLTFSVAA